MAVGVNESGEECFAFEIDALGVGGNGIHDFGQGADGDDLVSADGDGVGVGVLRVGGKNLGVKENLFVGGFLRRGGGEKKEYRNEEKNPVTTQESAHAITLS